MSLLVHFVIKGFSQRAGRNENHSQGRKTNQNVSNAAQRSHRADKKATKSKLKAPTKPQFKPPIMVRIRAKFLQNIFYSS